MPKQKSKKVGRPRLYDEPKTTHSIKATQTAWNGLKYLAASSELSLSEYLEFLGKTGVLPE
ncbi:MAG: hypothetical protein F6J94_04740 [Moorea sp. SIO1F2]|uniref:hypothetical protein n=1 Tax=unclassified Moorena TaxID=2683338 RepID=UPI0013B716DE|nr:MULTISPECIES: hypothetical protein [unclassified Moorena]NEN97923.1 hypothetical protein [Moorena sp. SIO3I7]NEO09097.1 hypothetical protein [Moorena sp. SIO3I8]NET81284.1 hypothetical protein [Moorena sp. SIO1F2]